MLGRINSFSDLVSLRAAQQNRAALNRSFHRLATGRRINSGADDPAGLIAANNLDATLAALEAETSANERAIHMSDTADAAIGQISDLLGQAKSRVLANASDAGLSDEERAANQLEIDSILASADRIANTTSFNGTKLLDGSGSISASGARHSIQSLKMAELGTSEINGTVYTLADLRSGQPLVSTSSAHSESAAKVIGQAITDTATARAKLGAFSKHTLHTRLTQVAGSREKMLQDLSIIRDVDFAREIALKFRSELLDRASLGLLLRTQQVKGSILDIRA